MIIAVMQTLPLVGYLHVTAVLLRYAQ